jgi:hypothetical protein
MAITWWKKREKPEEQPAPEPVHTVTLMHSEKGSNHV